MPTISKTNALYLIVQGEGIFTCRHKSYPIARGSVFYCPMGENFSIRSEDALEYCYINFRGRRADELAERAGLSAHSPLLSPRDPARLAAFWLECIASGGEGAVDLLGEAVLLYTFAQVQTARREPNALLDRLLRLTEEGFTDPRFSLGCVAESLCYDPKYLSSYFKRCRGIAFTQYLRELRIKRAQFLIEQGLDSIKNIAILSGFSDPFYFSKVFKQETGLSPRAYIRRRGGNAEE